MWLLDVNLPNALTGLLRSYGIRAETAAARGWRELTNAELAQAAFRGGFRALLTPDRHFGTAAGRIIEALPELAIVIVMLPQAPEAASLAAFDAAWRTRAIDPIAGAVTEWP